MDPDGTRLNEDVQGPFTIRNTPWDSTAEAPGSGGWTFPITYKTLPWTTPKPETQALMEAILMAKPDAMYCHNAGFAAPLLRLARVPAECWRSCGASLWRGNRAFTGRAEMPWVEERALQWTRPLPRWTRMNISQVRAGRPGGVRRGWRWQHGGAVIEGFVQPGHGGAATTSPKTSDRESWRGRGWTRAEMEDRARSTGLVNAMLSA